MNAGWCKPFRKRLDIAQCEAQQEKTPHICDDCPGLEGQARGPGRDERDTTKPVMGEADMAPRGTCGKCNTPDVQIIGKGLCHSCRSEAIKDGSYDALPGKKSGPRKAVTPAPVSPPPAEPAEAAAPSLAAVDGAPRKGLLSGLFAPEESGPVFTLDFTGHEDLLTYVLDSENPNSDLIGLIDMLRNDRLRVKG